MGRLYNGLKRIHEKSCAECSSEIYQPLIQKFVTLITYEDLYLMRKMDNFFTLKENGKNEMFIDCGGFGVIVDKNDTISIHT